MIDVFVVVGFSKRDFCICIIHLEANRAYNVVLAWLASSAYFASIDHFSDYYLPMQSKAGILSEAQPATPQLVYLHVHYSSTKTKNEDNKTLLGGLSCQAGSFKNQK